MNWLNISILFIILIQPKLSFSQSTTLSDSKMFQNCESSTYHFDNKENDTTRISVYFKGIADTTACFLFGYVIDRKTLMPIENAIVALAQMPDVPISKNSTDKNGKFVIKGFGLIDANCTFVISHPKYKCLTVEGFHFSGTGEILNMKFKLKR